MLSSFLAAGYSMENSFAQAQAQLEEMYGERGMMSKEFAVMRSQLSMNRTLEELWGDFAKRSGIEEIRSFAQIFKAARRSGGQLGMIISHVSELKERISRRITVTKNRKTGGVGSTVQVSGES